uniref:Exonuclease domain-containing protein n=1 Tax=Opuntia streptacantha TaxID=393608 RepID=A0A7C9DEW6_OPUST
MASCRTFSSIPLIRCSSTVFSLIHFSTFPSSPRPVARARCVISSASRSIQYSSNTDPASDILTMRRTWKPMCLYYTQGKCTLMANKRKKASSVEFNDPTPSVWHDTAMPFVEVIREFEAWMTDHNLWRKERSGPLTKAAFVTCGNWDIKTKIPQQCRAPGMRTMLNELRIPLLGSHHLGIDDTKNIARLLQRMLADGVLMQITARRNPANPETVEFLFKNRIR